MRRAFSLFASLMGAVLLWACGQQGEITEAVLTNGASAPRAAPSWTQPAIATELNGPDAFESVSSDDERAAAIFGEMYKVLSHPRCLNCHTPDEQPRQGDALAMHEPPVKRGEANFGAPGMFCNTCHGEENVSFASMEGSIPGHMPWALAPLSMNWIGLSIGEVCEQIKDTDRNGGMSLEELYVHNATDGLVGWGWDPGEGKTPVPGTQAVFGALTRAWIDAGAACPTS